MEAENVRLKKLVADLSLDKEILKEAALKLLSPSKRRRVVIHIQKTFSKIVSQRRVCEVIGQPRSTQRYCASKISDEDR